MSAIRPHPLLLPELVHEILGHLRTGPEPPLVALLTASLVCRSWHIVVLPLLLREFSDLRFDERYPVVSMRRLAILLDEARKTRVLDSLNGKLRSVDVLLEAMYVRRRYAAIDQYAYNGSYASAIRSVLALVPNFTDLELRFPDLKTGRQYLDLVPFLVQLQKSHGSTIMRLHLDGFSEAIPRTHVTPLSPLLASLRNLTELRLWSVRIDSALAVALACCTKIQIAELHNTHIDATPSLFLTHWPDLHTFRLSTRTTNAYILDVVTSLISSAQNLHNLHILPPLHQRLLSSTSRSELRTALVDLVKARADILVELIVPDWVKSQEDANLFAALQTPMPMLQVLDVSLWTAFTGTEVLSVRWPRLRRIDLSRCHRVEGAFVRRVIGACPKLVEVRGEEENGWGVLKEAGFVGWPGGGVWMRREGGIMR